MKKNIKPKILILFFGGTIAMHKDEKTKALNTTDDIANKLLGMEPRLNNIADISSMTVDNLDSTNMTHLHWEKMVELIEKNYTKYDGFVITLGTNTLAYASSAISFPLKGIGKPVILTGSQIPGEVINTDGRNNFINSVRLATADISGVYVVFGSKIILGCRAKKISESDLDAFKTFNATDYGEIGVGFKINNHTNHRHNKKFKVINGFEDNIACLTLIPGLREDAIINLIDNNIKGIILRAYGSGDIPYSLLPALKLAQKKKVPVVVTTQCPGGATIMGMNDVGLQALHTGVIQAFDMSMETMSTKLMWLLKQKTPYNLLRKKMHENMLGEVNVNRAKLFKI